MKNVTRADAESSSETAKGAGSDAAIAARRRGTRRGRVPDATPRRDGAANMSLALERVSPREEVTGCRVIVDDDVRDHVRCVKHPSPEISKPRVDAVGGSAAHSAMRASAVSLSRLVWRRPGAWHRRASWTPLRCTASSDRPSVRPLPRLEPRDGPSYAVDVGGGAVAHLRFLAFHGCGSRFSVLWKADASDEGGGFDAGELERLSATWRVRTAAGSSAALEALEGFDGDDVKRLALRDDDLGARRLYDASDPSWSAARAAPTWPARLLAALDAGGGAAGDDALVCVDGSYFLELVRLSAPPTPGSSRTARGASRASARVRRISTRSQRRATEWTPSRRSRRRAGAGATTRAVVSPPTFPAEVARTSAARAVARASAPRSTPPRTDAWRSHSGTVL